LPFDEFSLCKHMKFRKKVKYSILSQNYIILLRK
jgi:hypothetical protein